MKVLTLFLLGISFVLAEDAVSQELPNANNIFTSSVYRELSKKKVGNFMTSPFSVENILSLTQSGCKNETGQEIRTALRLPNDNLKIQSDVKATLAKLRGDKYTLQSANKIYVKENFFIREKFRNEAVEVYQSEVETIDFGQNWKAARTINDWVAKMTANKIQNLISAYDLNDRTRAIVINALYFKGEWRVSFPPMVTRKADFYKSLTQVVKVDTMYLDDEEFLYYECSHLNAKFLELPFKGEEASVTIVLPNEKEGLSRLEHNIDRVFLPHDLKMESVVLSLPKFKIETEINFKNILQNLGIKKVFDDNEADLSGIAGVKGDIIVDKIIQKTFIDLNEEGVEAAAATYIPAIVPEMGAFDSPKPFIVDHPFIFYIKVRGVILFAGRVVVPEI